MKEKFLIQAIVLPDKKTPKEIEQLWATYRNDPNKIENTRLKLRIDGIENTEKMRSISGATNTTAQPQAVAQQSQDLFPSVKSSRAGLSQFGSVASTKLASAQQQPLK